MVPPPYSLVVGENDLNVYALCTLESGLDTISLVSRAMEISGVVGLVEPPPGATISGFVDVESFCRDHRIRFIPVQAYSLKNATDRDLLEKLEMDVLLITGWQRLIPDWLIRHCRVGAVGFHGSASGITGGRGRSPQNWALILDKDRFEVSIFFVDSGIDSGRVIDSRTFPLLDGDNIRTSYYKVSWCVAEMFITAAREGRLSPSAAVDQPHEEARYFPQRLPEDGAIDWSRSSRDIYNFVRALTRPYPGAFSAFQGCELQVWEARPFDTGSRDAAGRPGEVLAVMAEGELVIRTGDGKLLVSDYTLRRTGDEPRLSPGLVLPSMPYAEQIGRIVERHRAKYPSLKVVEELEQLAAPTAGPATGAAES